MPLGGAGAVHLGGGGVPACPCLPASPSEVGGGCQVRGGLDGGWGEGVVGSAHSSS